MLLVVGSGIKISIKNARSDLHQAGGCSTRDG
jgi:hypothetical protein